MISCSGYCLFACKYPSFNRSIINKRWEGCNRSISKHAGDWTAHMSCMNKNYWDSCTRGHSPRVLCLSEFIIKWRNGLLVWSPPAEQTRVITADPCDHSCPYYTVCWQTVWLTPEEKKSMVIFTAPLPPLAKIRTLLEYGMHLCILHFQLVFFLSCTVPSSLIRFHEVELRLTVTYHPCAGSVLCSEVELPLSDCCDSIYSADNIPASSN